MGSLQNKQVSFPEIKSLGIEVAMRQEDVSELSAEARGAKKIYM